MLPDKIIKKVPGQISQNPKEKQGYLEDLSKLSKVSLLDIFERQNKLLNSRAFIAKLADKGERLRTLQRRVEVELKRRDEIGDICDVMSGLKIEGKRLSEHLEWQGKSVTSTDLAKTESEISEEDDTNPIKILATHSGTTYNKKDIRINNNTSQSSVIESNNGEVYHEEPYVKNLRQALDNVTSKSRFLPFKTLEKTKEIDKSKERDISAATPPLPKYGDTKLVTLEESLKLQAEQAQHLREVQVKHAAERLKEKGVVMGDDLPPLETISHYRESPPSDSEEEVIDEDAKEEKGGVTFSLSY